MFNLRNIKIHLLSVFLLSTLVPKLQPVSISPLFPNRNDVITVTYDATQGNGALSNISPVYMHTGVLTENSTSPSDWKYVQGNWGTADNNVLMTNLGGNKFSKTYSIPAFYGVPAGDTIIKLAFVFRNADGTVAGREADGRDFFVEVYDNSLQVKIFTPNSTNAYSGSLNSSFNVFAAASDNCNLSLNWDGNPLSSVFNDSIFYNNLSLLTYGEHILAAKAILNGDTATDTLHVFVNPNVSIQNPPSGTQDGINYLNDSTVLLQLTAPGKSFVYVIGDFNNWQPSVNYFMKKSANGDKWWLQISGLIPQQEYVFQYLVDGIIRIGDPYCDKIVDPFNDGAINAATYPNLISYPFGKTTGRASVLQTAQTPYNWQVTNFTRPAKDTLVIYELLVRDFQSGHTYQKVIDSLDYLQRLGINAVQLMPVMEFENNDSWGYNPIYFFAPDKYYGTKNDLKKLVDECHKRGIAVLLDIALNHAFGSSPMVMLYWDAANNQPAANSPWFNQQPKHPFNVGYDFNHESPYTKQFVKDVTRYWLREYHVDGYRFDLTKGFTQNNTGNDVGAWGAYDASRISLLKAMVDSIRVTDPTAIITFEHLSDNSEEIQLSNHGILLWGNLNYQYCEAAMGYYTNSDLSWGSYQSRGWNAPNLITYAESHDEQRLMFKSRNYGASAGNYDITDIQTALARSELAGAFLFPIPGPKLLWQFGEYGYDIDINFICRVCAKPILWNYLQNASKLKLFKVWSELIHLKKTYAPFRTSNFNLSVGNAAGKRIKLNHSDFNIVVLGNFGITNQNLVPAFQNTGWWYEYFSGDSINVTDVNATLGFLPGEYRLYTSKYIGKADIAVSTQEILATLEVSSPEIFPNPASSQLNLLLKLQKPEVVDWSIYDLNGRQVYTTSQLLQEGNQMMQCNTTGFAEGMYVWKLKAGQEVFNGKVSIDR